MYCQKCISGHSLFVVTFAMHLSDAIINLPYFIKKERIYLPKRENHNMKYATKSKFGIWKKNGKILWDLNGNGQRNDNCSNFLVCSLVKLSPNSITCPISVKRWHRMTFVYSCQHWPYFDVFWV